MGVGFGLGAGQGRACASGRELDRLLQHEASSLFALSERAIPVFSQVLCGHVQRFHESKIICEGFSGPDDASDRD